MQDGAAGLQIELEDEDDDDEKALMEMSEEELAVNKNMGPTDL